MIVAAPSPLGAVAMAAGAGFGVGKRRLLCASCGGAVTRTDTECERCGGRIVGDLARIEERAAREAEYAARHPPGEKIADPVR